MNNTVLNIDLTEDIAFFSLPVYKALITPFIQFEIKDCQSSHANDLLNRQHDVLICPHNLIYRTNDLIKRAHEIFINANDMITRWHGLIVCAHNITARMHEMTMQEND